MKLAFFRNHFPVLEDHSLKVFCESLPNSYIYNKWRVKTKLVIR